MKSKSLLKKLRVLGYPLFEKEESLDVNATLAKVVQSRDLRLWEGFPVLLANCALKGLFSYDMVKRHLKKSFDKRRFKKLVLMSLVVYKVLGVKFSWANKLYSLPSSKGKDYQRMLKAFKARKEFLLAGRSISPKRLLDNFKRYFQAQEKELSDQSERTEMLEFEYALSQLFSPKQKELFLRKLKREKLTKTEKEYYSRAVKKKVLALANTKLHKLAGQLIK